MRTFNAFRIITISVSFLLGVIAAQAQSAMHARVSFDAGATMVRGTEDAEWSHANLNTLVLPGDTLWSDDGGTSELELVGGTFLRMADRSKVELYALPPSAGFRAWTGSFYVHRINRSTGAVVIQTPATSVQIERDTVARIDVASMGSTTLTVRWGSASVRAGSSLPQQVTSSQRVYIDPGMLPSNPVPIDLSDEDDFDAWNRDRVQLMATGYSAVPRSISPTIDTLGVADLDAYGERVEHDQRTYWRPTVVANYVPYREGYWSFVPTVGYVWIDAFPFAYTTSHYGRWTYANQYGWMWCYEAQWSPAWVATVRCGSNLLWTPVDFHSRPVNVSSSATFTVGGIAFSFAASTCVPRDHLYYGSTYVAPVRPQMVQNLTVNNVNIWNINVNQGVPYVNVPYKDQRLTVVNYNPKEIIRGPERVYRRDYTAQQAAEKLERRVDRTAFAADDTTKTPQSKTALVENDDLKKLRKVRLAPEQRVAHRVPIDTRQRDAGSDTGIAEKSRRDRAVTPEQEMEAPATSTPPARDYTAHPRKSERGSENKDVKTTTRERHQRSTTTAPKQRMEAPARDNTATPRKIERRGENKDVKTTTRERHQRSTTTAPKIKPPTELPERGMAPRSDGTPSPGIPDGKQGKDPQNFRNNQRRDGVSNVERETGRAQPVQPQQRQRGSAPSKELRKTPDAGLPESTPSEGNPLEENEKPDRSETDAKRGQQSGRG